ncbi:MAG: amidase, partial [Anaerolineales bacterium]|nr:amidase [Anaerolineales bacterium]
MEELTLAELQKRMASGELTARVLAEWYLERIARLDVSGPRLNSVIEVNPRALDLADALDTERRGGRVRGPLHGLPLLVKDNLDTADEMQTTAGSLALEGWRARSDAGVVQRLRAAGALILGKTNLSEWANFRGRNSSSGWSSRGGQTRNPYALDRNPSGSSSGSGVAAAANLCAAAIGTETDGSILSPCNVNGLVGLKPTVGLVSRAGIIPISASQDTAGPMARSVADAALLLGAMAGEDPRDPATALSRGRAEADYTRYLDPNGLRGARLGVVRSLFGAHRGLCAVMETCLETLRRLGAEVLDPVDWTLGPEVDANELLVLHYEFKDGLNRYLDGLGPDTPVHSLADVITFNECHVGRVMPFFGQEHMLEAEAKGGLDSAEYQQALADNRRQTREEGIDRLLQAHRLDALVAPAGGPAWLTDHVNGDHYGGSCSQPPAIAGYPSLTVPAGQVFGLPVGLGFFASAFQEGTLLRLGFAFEQAT